MLNFNVYLWKIPKLFLIISKTFWTLMVFTSKLSLAKLSPHLFIPISLDWSYISLLILITELNIGRDASVAPKIVKVFLLSAPDMQDGPESIPTK